MRLYYRVVVGPGSRELVPVKLVPFSDFGIAVKVGFSDYADVDAYYEANRGNVDLPIEIEFEDGNRQCVYLASIAFKEVNVAPETQEVNRIVRI